MPESTAAQVLSVIHLVLPPVTAEFKDVNGDGKPDMIVHVGDQQFIYLNDGTQFKLQE